MRGIFWSTMGVLALYLAGYLVAGVLLSPYVTPSHLRAREKAIYAYVERLKGNIIASSVPAGDRICSITIFVDANDPIEDLTYPEVNSYCEVIR